MSKHKFSAAELATLARIYDAAMLGKAEALVVARQFRDSRSAKILERDEPCTVEVLGVPYTVWYDDDQRWRRFISCRGSPTPGWWQASCINHGVRGETKLSVSILRGDIAAMRTDLCAARFALG